jgi:uncharacterized repeat protein (TIGR01451 family)
MIRSLFARAGELAPRVLGCVRNAALAAGLVLAPALAQAAFTVTPLTWNVVGLDSNSPASGPRHFPVGARVCTTTAATGINVSFAWTTANANVNLRPGTLSAIPIASLAAGACSDAYFEVEVTPVAAAYDTTRRYVITAADSVNSATSPTPRELYVEHLISQSRNSITDIKLDGVSVPPGGSMNLVVGQTYSIELDGGTATQGYNQFEAFINIPNTIFQVLAVSTTYSADNSPYVPNPNDKLYADACLWDNNPGSPNYRSCAGDFKAGGSDVRTTYTVRIVGGGGSQQSINSLLYDFSGSSYHYNADYGVGARIANIIDPASLTFAKAFTPSPAVAGGTSTLTFTITNPNAGAIAGVSFSDPLPLLSGSQMVVATPATFSTSNCGTPTFAPTAGASTVSISNATVPANGACVVNVRVFIPSLPATGTYANVSNNLFVGALDTGKTASANLALTSFAPPSGSCGLVLAQWTMAAAAPTTVPPAFSTKAADVTTATAAAGAGITSAISTTIGNPVNSWGASGWSNAAVLSTSSNDYFEFAATTTNYTSITFSFDAQRTVAPQYGPQSLQLYYSTDGTNFTAYGSAIATGTSWATVSVPFTGTANASGLTYFRIYGYDAANSGTNPQLFIDNITIGGCQTTQPATLTKSFSPNPIAVGGTSTLTFTLANPNATSLTGVRFTDALPAGLQVAASPGASTTCGGSPTWAPAGGATSLTFGSPTGATIGGGSSCTVTVNVTATTSGPHTNVSGFAASTEGGTNTGGTGSAVASLTAILPPVLAKDFGASPLLAGGTSLLTITLTNPNVNDALSGVAFSDTYPAGLVNVNPLTPAVGNTCGGTVTAAAGGNGVSLASGTLGAGASCTVTVTVTSAAAGAYVNTTGNVSAATAGTGNSDSATLTVVNPTPAISLNKQVGTSATGPWLKFVTVAPGTPLFYRFTVENVGDVAFNPFNVSDPTLAGTAVDPATCVWQTPNVPSTLPALPVATATIDPTATCVLGPVTAGNGDFPNTATAHGTFSGTQYNSESSTAEYIGAPPGFSLLKQISTGVDGPWSSAINVSAGTSVFYRFLLVNTGALPLTAINVTDPLVSTAGCAFTDPLAVGASTLCVAGPVTAAGGNGSTTTNTATGHGTNGATVYDTAISSASYTIGSASADLAVTKTVDNATPNVGSNVTFTVTVTNNGPSTAAGVSVADALPAGYSFVSATPSVGTYSSGTWTIGAMANGASATLSITGTVQASGAYANTATASTTTTDPNSGNNSATSTPVPVAQADLAVTKNVDNATPGVGSNVTFTVTVTNNGPSAAAGVSVSDALPAGYSFVSATPSVGSYSSGTWTLGALANGASATLSITATVQATGPYANTATVSATTTDPNSGNNSATSTPVPVAQADLAVTKIVDNATPNVGSNVTFTVTVTNNGPNDAAGVSVADALPAGYALVSATPSTGTYSSGTWTIGALANGASATLSITATVLASGSYANTATASATTNDPNGGNNSATSTPVPVAQADLAVTKIVDNGTPIVGTNVTFTVTVTNNGPSAAAGVSVADALPAGYSFVSATPSVGSYSSGTWTIGALANSASATLSITATVQASGPYTNTATVSATTTDPNGSNNSASSTPTPGVQADLAVTKTVDNATPNVGSNVTFTVTVTNNGPNAAAGVSVADALPAGYSFVSATPSVGSYSSGTWTIGALANGASVTLSITATVQASGPYANTATVSASTTDPNGGNNSATSTPVPVAQADLAVTKTVDNTSPSVGNNVTFTVTVTNNGPSAAAGVSVADALPAGYSFVSATPSVGSYSSGTWTIGAMANGANATLAITATVQASGPYTNTATVSATSTDPNSGNNSASSTPSVGGTADLSITKTNGVTSLVAGGPVTYTIVALNAGPSAVTGATVADTLPGTITGATWTCSGSGGGTCPASGNGSINAAADLPVGASVTFILTGTVASSATGSLSNTATIAAPSGVTDPNTNNNSANDTDPVQVQVALAVVKTDGSASYTPGGTATYTVTVTNTGPSLAANLTLADTLPAGVTLTANVNCVAAGNASCGTVTGLNGQSSFGTTGATLGAAAADSLTFTAPVAFAANLTANPLVNQASATDVATGANAQGTDSNTLASQVALSVVKTDGSASYTPGGTATYTVTVANGGVSNATNVTVTDSLPAGVTLTGTVTCTANGAASCGAVTGTSGQSAFGATGAQLGAGAGNSIVFTVPVAFAASLATTPLVNTAQATDVASGATGSGSDSNARAPAVTLAVTKSDGSATYVPGGSATYTIVVTSTGLSDALDVSVSDSLPAGVTLSANASCVAAGLALCGTVTGTTGQTSFGATGAAIAAGAGNSLTFTVPVTFAANLADNPLINAATANDTLSGASATGSDSNALAAQAGLAVTKSDGSATYTPGGTATYAIVVTNSGPSNAASVTVSDSLPAGATLSGNVTCTPAGTATCGTVTGTTGQTTLGTTGATIAAGAGNSLTFSAPVAFAAGLSTNPLVNTVTVTDPAAPDAGQRKRQQRARVAGLPRRGEDRRQRHLHTGGHRHLRGHGHQRRRVQRGQRHGRRHASRGRHAHRQRDVCRERRRRLRHDHRQRRPVELRRHRGAGPGGRCVARVHGSGRVRRGDDHRPAGEHGDGQRRPDRQHRVGLGQRRARRGQRGPRDQQDRQRRERCAGRGDHLHDRGIERRPGRGDRRGRHRQRPGVTLRRHLDVRGIGGQRLPGVRQRCDQCAGGPARGRHGHVHALRHTVGKRDGNADQHRDDRPARRRDRSEPRQQFGDRRRHHRRGRGRRGSRDHQDRQRDECGARRRSHLYDRGIQRGPEHGERRDRHRQRPGVTHGRDVDLRRLRRQQLSRGGQRKHQRDGEPSRGRHGRVHALRHAVGERDRNADQHRGDRVARRRDRPEPRQQLGDRRRYDRRTGHDRGPRDPEDRRCHVALGRRGGDLHDRRHQQRPGRGRRRHGDRHDAPGTGQRDLDVHRFGRQRLPGRRRRRHQRRGEPARRRHRDVHGGRHGLDGLAGQHRNRGSASGGGRSQCGQQQLHGPRAERHRLRGQGRSRDRQAERGSVLARPGGRPVHHRGEQRRHGAHLGDRHGDRRAPAGPHRGVDRRNGLELRTADGPVHARRCPGARRFVAADRAHREHRARCAVADREHGAGRRRRRRQRGEQLREERGEPAAHPAGCDSRGDSGQRSARAGARGTADADGRRISPRAPPLGITPKKKAGAYPGFFCNSERAVSGSLDVARLLALRALGDFEGDLLAFLERLEPRHVDRGEMCEEILASAIRCNESEALRVVKPLHGTCCHF